MQVQTDGKKTTVEMCSAELILEEGRYPVVRETVTVVSKITRPAVLRRISGTHFKVEMYPEGFAPEGNVSIEQVMRLFERQDLQKPVLILFGKKSTVASHIWRTYTVFELGNFWETKALEDATHGGGKTFREVLEVITEERANARGKEMPQVEAALFIPRHLTETRKLVFSNEDS